jgi:hypothetical protein
MPSPENAVPNTALAILSWLERYAHRIDFQDLAPRKRRKNRVILQFRSPRALEYEAVGATTLPDALTKAAIRMAAVRKAS